MVRNVWLKDLFGVTISIKSDFSSLIRYTQLVDKVRSRYDASHVNSKQLD